MLQKNLSAFIRSCPRDFLIQIESNGTRILDDLPKVRTNLVVSPKIPQKSPTDDSTYGPLPNRVLERADALKFIVTADVDSPYHHIPMYAKAFQMAGKPIYVSPMAVYTRQPEETASIWDPTVFDVFRTADNHAYACDLVKKHGYIMSMQMHLFCGVE
jgi:organic radical activating enzyme